MSNVDTTSVGIQQDPSEPQDISPSIFMPLFCDSGFKATDCHSFQSQHQELYRTQLETFYDAL